MSKSKGNVIAPQKIFDTLGADILRLWAAATDYSGELTISDEILKRVVEIYRRIRNTLRFLLANIADFDVARDTLPVEQWLEIDRYALAPDAEAAGQMCAPITTATNSIWWCRRCKASVPKTSAASTSTSSRTASIPRR